MIHLDKGTLADLRERKQDALRAAYESRLRSAELEHAVAMAQIDAGSFGGSLCWACGAINGETESCECPTKTG